MVPNTLKGLSRLFLERLKKTKQSSKETQTSPRLYDKLDELASNKSPHFKNSRAFSSSRSRQRLRHPVTSPSSDGKELEDRRSSLNVTSSKVYQAYKLNMLS